MWEVCEACDGYGKSSLEWVDPFGNVEQAELQCYLCDGDGQVSLFQINCLNPALRDAA